METKWYEANMRGHQGLIIDEKTGANIAVVYDKKDAPLIAAAPELAEALMAMLEMSENNGFGKAYAEDVARAALKAAGVEV